MNLPDAVGEALLELFADMRTFFDETADPTGSRLPQPDRNRVSAKTIKQFERWTDRCSTALEEAARG